MLGLGLASALVSGLRICIDVSVSVRVGVYVAFVPPFIIYEVSG